MKCISSRRQAVVLLLMFVVVVACGKKGNPKPPEYLAPMPVTNFLANGSVDGINLSWTPPTKNADGDDLRDLERFFVYRSGVVKDESRDYELVQEIVVAADIVPAEKKSKTSTPRPYTYLDKDVKPGKEYDYYVVPVNEGGTKGKESPILRVTFIGQSSAVRILAPEESEY